jgi:hypothetical protein
LIALENRFQSKPLKDLMKETESFARNWFY